MVYHLKDHNATEKGTKRKNKELEDGLTEYYRPSSQKRNKIKKM